MSTVPVRVLLVDDSQPFRFFVSEMLRNQPGFEIVGEADNDVQAVQKAAELRPDLILLDLVMPGLDGRGFLTQRQAEPAAHEIPVVVVSGTPMLADESRPAGVMAMLVKPVDLGVLLALVNWLVHAV